MDDVYNQFKHEFFPGEHAIAKVNDQRISVIVREKAKFNAIALPSGEVRPAYCKCRVEHHSTGEESIIDESQLSRDRKYFTKIILRTFIKYSVHRDSWAGAPWLVKDEYAQKFRIDQTIPLNLQKHKGQPSPNELKQQRIERRLQQKEEKLRVKQEKAREAKQVKQENKLVLKEQHLLMQRQKQLLKQEQILEAQRGKAKNQNELDQINQQQKQLQEHQQQLKRQSEQLQELSNSTAEPGSRLAQLQTLQKEFQEQNKQYESSVDTPFDQQELVDLLSNVATTPKRRGRAPNSTANSGTATPMNEEVDDLRPQIVQDDLLFPFDYARALKRPAFQKVDFVPQELVSTLLETWLFMNIYSEPLVLDTFTFDDYIDVLRFDDTETECALLNEIHCALLCAFIGTENTELLVQLPDPPEDPRHFDEYSDEEEDEEDEEDDEKQDEANSQDKKENDEDSEGEKESSPPEPETNKSEQYAVFKNTDWKERLRRRLFKDGGWQQIIVGLLHSLLYVPQWKEDITAILDVLAPLEESVALYTCYAAYMEKLSIAHKVRIIQILCDLLHSSQLVRNYIDKCMEESIRIRRERLENLREYKALLEEIKGYEEQKKTWFPNGFTVKVVTPEPDENGLVSSVGTTATPPPVLVLNGSGNKRGAATSLARQMRKKRKDDAELQLSKTNAQFRKVYQICEDAQTKAADLLELNKKGEAELVKLDCQRMKMLGMDRYCNRYWWLEGNGLRRHRPDGETKDKHKKEEVKKEDGEEDDDDDEEGDLGFLMGRLWVQGPTEHEAKGYLGLGPEGFAHVWKDESGKLLARPADAKEDEPSPEVKILVNETGVVSDLTIPEKKLVEEFPLPLVDTNSWVYLEKPSDIDLLIQWLNPYGKREMKLIQELKNAHTQISDSMQARTEDLKRDLALQNEEVQKLRDENEELAQLGRDDKSDRELLERLEEDAATNEDYKYLQSQDDEMKDVDADAENEESKDAENEDEDDDDEPIRAGKRRRRSSRLPTPPPPPAPRGPGRPPKSPPTTVTNGDSTANGRKRRKTVSDEDPEEKAIRLARSRAKKIAEVKQHFANRQEEREEIERDMHYQVKLSRMLGWENHLAVEKLGHGLYESGRKRGRVAKKKD